MSYFYQRNNPVLHCCATEPLRLGRARILRETAGGALVREDAAGMYILAADSLADAQELLRDCRCKVYEVAEQVGYRDVTYFSSTFKKVAGMSPSEYQDRSGSAVSG